MSRSFSFEDGLNCLAVIRTTFETLEVFPDDPDLVVEMETMIRQAREQLVGLLAAAGDEVRSGANWAVDLREFRRTFMGFLADGLNSIRFESMMKAPPVLQAEDDGRRRYRLHPSNSRSELELLEPRDLLAAVIDDLRLWAEDDRTFATSAEFNRTLDNNYFIAAFAYHVSIDPAA
jgi:hypothetical protein